MRLQGRNGDWEFLQLLSLMRLRWSNTFVDCTWEEFIIFEWAWRGPWASSAIRKHWGRVESRQAVNCTVVTSFSFHLLSDSLAYLSVRWLIDSLVTPSWKFNLFAKRCDRKQQCRNCDTDTCGTQYKIKKLNYFIRNIGSYPSQKQLGKRHFSGKSSGGPLVILSE